MKIPAAILFTISFFLQGSVTTVSVPIQNPSFEQGTLSSTSCGFSSASIPGWKVAARPGWLAETFQPTGCDIPVPPDGSNAAYDGFSTISQDLGVKASYYQPTAKDGLYVMRLHAANYYRPYPAYYEAKLLIGDKELCSTDGWAVGNFTELILVCPSSGYLVHYNGMGFNGSNNLVVSLSMNGGWPVLFDDVSLTFTPN